MMKESAAATVADAFAPKQAVDGATGVRSVQRALEILALITDERPTITIREILEATGLAKTTVIRLAQTLVNLGLLWDTGSGYTAGPGLWHWAHLARTAWELPQETRTMMRDLAAEHQETVNVYVRRDIHRICIAQAESPRALRHVVRVGDELPLWGGASSRVLLSGQPVEVLARVVTQAPSDHRDLHALASSVEEATKAGFAVSHGEREAGVSAVAVPLYHQGETVIAALSLSGATARFTPDRVAVFAAALKDAAAAMAGRGIGVAVQDAVR